MFREMRKKKKSLPEAEIISILQSCSSGVLAVEGDDDYPYAVPLSYAYKEGKLYFHSALEGYKIDGITKNNKVSFCVIKTDDVIPDRFTTLFRSVIIFGRARILTDEREKRYALECIVEKYSPNFIGEGHTEIERNWDRFNAIEVQIEHMTGKAASELINNQA